MIQDALLTAVQPHPAGAPTATVARSTAPAGTERPAAPSENVHPASVTVTVWAYSVMGKMKLAGLHSAGSFPVQPEPSQIRHP